MSRFFDGQFGSHAVSFSSGAASFDQGPITIAVLLKGSASLAGAFGIAVMGRNSTPANVWSLAMFDRQLFMENDFVGGPQITTGDWLWVVVTHPSAGTPRWHVQDVTIAGAWSHVDEVSGTVGDGTGPVASVYVGAGDGSGSSTFRGWIAAVAVWGSALSDAAVQAACTLNATDLAAASPAWGTLWDQTSTGTPVSDFTGGGGNQTAILGTTADAGENPPGFSYSLSAPGPVAQARLVGQAVNRSYTY